MFASTRRGMRVPVAAVDVRLERRDLEIVLDVDGQRVDDRADGGSRARSWRPAPRAGRRPRAREPARQVPRDARRGVAVPELRRVGRACRPSRGSSSTHASDAARGRAPTSVFVPFVDRDRTLGVLAHREAGHARARSSPPGCRPSRSARASRARHEPEHLEVALRRQQHDPRRLDRCLRRPNRSMLARVRGCTGQTTRQARATLRAGSRATPPAPPGRRRWTAGAASPRRSRAIRRRDVGVGAAARASVVRGRTRARDGAAAASRSSRCRRSARARAARPRARRLSAAARSVV